MARRKIKAKIDTSKSAIINVIAFGKTVYTIYHGSWGHPEGRFGLVGFIHSYLKTGKNGIDAASMTASFMVRARFKQYRRCKSFLISKDSNIDWDYRYDINIDGRLKIFFKIEDHEIPLFDDDISNAKDDFSYTEYIDKENYYKKAIEFFQNIDKSKIDIEKIRHIEI